MISITYSSKYKGNKNNFKETLAGIYEASQRNNPILGISGVLLHNQQYFLQTLEGEANSVHQLMGKIKQDPRHCDIKVLLENTVQKRKYPNWNMQPIDLMRPQLFNTDNIEKLTDYMKEMLTVDSETFHLLLKDLLNDPNINQVLEK